MAWVPPDWLAERGEAPASDLDLAVLLLNSHDLLEDPADRLADLTWWCEALRAVGHEQLAAAHRRDDLSWLRRLRTTLRTVFEADDDTAAVVVLNAALLEARAVVQLGPAGVGVTGLGTGGDLAARLLVAVATQVADRGVRRLGLCASDPCRCAFVDRTRAGSRRYCCTVCNDRAAARAYRRRRGPAQPTGR